MEAVIATVGEALLSAAFEALFDKLGSADLINYARQEQVADDIKKWETMLNQISGVLDDAEEKQMANRSVKRWMSALRDLAYDVEDILDEFYTEVQRRKLKGEPVQEASTSKLKNLIPRCCGFSSRTVKFNTQMISKIKEIDDRFDEIMKQKGLLHLVESIGGRGRNQILSPREEASLENEADVHGRQKDKESILETLKSVETEANVSVVPIVGMGGLGKTTLALLIFNDPKPLQFDLKYWVSVGDDFDVFRMTKIILSKEGCDDGGDLISLQVKLKEKLSLKKFLIVLDDVWTENYEDWTRFSAPFKVSGAPGSIIIITTRSQRVSSKMRTVEDYLLKELTYDDCMHVFTQHALGAKDFEEHKNLEGIGREIVKKCGGLPLAAKALGGLLRRKPNHNSWEEVLNSEIWNISNEEINVLPSLKLSYFHLSSHLKQCFSYCAIFPKDYEFDKEELILLWMAQGFLYQPEKSKKRKPMQVLGCQYFDDLLSRSFFQQSSSDKSRYVMHDLMNDLAQFVSGEICFRSDDKFDGVESCAKIRHSSFIRDVHNSWQHFQGFFAKKNMRTFLSLSIDARDTYARAVSSKVTHELVPELKCLRVLSLAGYAFEELPRSIGALKHLPYLNLSLSLIKKLPEIVFELFNLQTLILRGCIKLVGLPPAIENLINLECLDISGTDELKEMPPQVGKLRNLYKLTKFIVGNENGLKLKELGKFPHLQGTLQIIGLRNVMDVQDADFANLKQKQRLEELYLEWGEDDSNGSRNPSTEAKVLNSLRPHQNVSRLSVESFGGTEFPLWIADPSFTKMVKLNLCKCRNIRSLPPLGQLPSLKELEIGGMDGVKEVGAEFHGDTGSYFVSLESLVFYDMLGWEQWCYDLNDVNGEARRIFPKLHELCVSNCPKLVGKLPCAPSLRELSISRCQEEVLRSLFDLTSLTTLKIERISGLVSLHEAHIENLVGLQDLYIRECEELKYLWKDGTNLDKLACLKLLAISRCKQLVSLVEGEEGQLPCNLGVLEISECDNLEKLPNGLHSLTSLRDLKISECRKLLSFSATGVPHGLRNLHISRCDSLESLPEGIIMPHNQSELEVLRIVGCKSLRSSPRGEFPESLQTLGIRDCNWPTQLFESLFVSPNGFSHLSELKIENCQQLTQFPIHTLTFLSISNCENLTSLPNTMQCLTSLSIFDCKNLTSLPNTMQSLTSLSIENCENLTSLPNSTQNLTSLSIFYCKNLSSLPNTMQSLTSLSISDCKNLSSLPNAMQNLTFLRIYKCENLRSLPNQMQNFTALKKLYIESYSGLESFPEGGLPPNLSFLSICKCENLKQPMGKWGLHRLTSLEIFGMRGPCPSTDMFDSFPDNDGLLLPTSVFYLRIGEFNNLKSFSRGLLKLTSLRRLHIWDCPNLQSFPEESLPASLEWLWIDQCPILKERCSKENGRYWPFISHISRIDIRE